MNSKQILFSTALGLFSLALAAQEKSRTYKETFNVSNDAVLEINTSHTDIEFETWNKDQVEITAVVELEGANEEDANDYFNKRPIEIKGNSHEIEVSTSGRGSWLSNDFRNNLSIVTSDIEPLFLDLELPELPELAILSEMPELPVMPPVPFTNFDYGEFKKDGDAYMKKWKKEFDENFDEDYQKRMEEWGKRMKKKAEEWEERNAERLEKMERRAEERAKALEKRQKAMEERREAMEERQNAIRLRHDRNIIISRDGEEEPSIFYFSSNGENKKYKVKKTIKVKMPKSVKLKMNVKHGEVKLASTAKDVNASLRYASLLASTIEGDLTNIRASYSPVLVQKWNYGQLITDYSDRVNLKEVDVLTLNSTSSSIIIDKLNKKASLNNNLGELTINSVSTNFSNVDIVVKNGEVYCKIPSCAFLVEVDETQSTLKYPKNLIFEQSKGFGNVFHTGYNINEKAPKSIKIDSRYSEVVLED